MNTPGTEWETEFEEKFLNDALDAFPEHPQTMALFLINIKTFIATLLTSRDTYWKERVRKEYQAIKETPAYVNLMTQWGQLDEDGECIAVSRQALEETTQALDTLLDNLK